MNKLDITSLIIGIILIVIQIGFITPSVDGLFYFHPLMYPVLGTIGDFRYAIGLVGLVLGIIVLIRKARRWIAITAIVLNTATLPK